MIFSILNRWILKVVFFRNSVQQSSPQNASLLLSLLFSAFLAAGTFIPLYPATAAPTVDVWLAVDTNKLSLTIMQGDTKLKLFENIAIGSNGPTLVKQRDDQTTPLGEFTITEIRRSQRFELFMEFNYPNLDHTERAFAENRIDASVYKALRYNLDRGKPPSQSTPLGGQLGIHGLGKGDQLVHESVNWTDGCIALTNEQLKELAGWVAVGTRVVVR